MKYLLSTVFLLVYGRSSCRADDDLNSTLILQYDRMVCDNEPTCSLVNHFAIPDDRRSLDRRNCMCDIECAEYRDCCYDSASYARHDQSQPQSYYCPPTINVYMKTNCPAWWTDDYIARQCAKSTKPLDSDDVMLILPVTNLDTRITYGNAFCAYCHNDRTFQPWLLVPSCEPLEPEPIQRQEPSPEPPPSYNPGNPTVSIFVSTNPFLPAYAMPTGPPVRTVVDVYLYQQYITGTNGNFMPISPVTVSTSYNQNGVFMMPAVTPVTVSTSYTPNAGASRYTTRRVRQSDYNQYSAYRPPFDSEEVWKSVKFDSPSTRFVSTYNGVNFVCEVGPKLPDDVRKNVRTCVPNLIDTCPPGTDTVQVQLCREATSIVYNKHTKRAYRNKFCAFCNLELKAYLTGCVEKTEEEFFRSFKPSLGGLHGGTDPCSRIGASRNLNCQAS